MIIYVTKHAIFRASWRGFKYSAYSADSSLVKKWLREDFKKAFNETKFFIIEKGSQTYSCVDSSFKYIFKFDGFGYKSREEMTLITVMEKK